MPRFNSLLPADGGSSLGVLGGVSAYEQETTRTRDLFFLYSPGGHRDKRILKMRKPFKRPHHLKNSQL